MASGGFNFNPSPGGFNKAPGGITFKFTSQTVGGPQQTTGPPPGLNFTGQPTAGSSAATAAAPPSPDEDSAAGSKFSHLHKDHGSKQRSDESQKKRAVDQLTKQKEKRYDFLNHVRKITDLFAEDEEEEENQQQTDWLKIQKELGDQNAKESLDAIEERKQKLEERKNEVWRFRNQLMHSEWLLEKPGDFDEKWVMVPVPQGRRNLIIATGGQTSAYAKNGMCMSRFSSHLPGGGKHKHKWNFETAILDCVFNEVTKSYYILDMMCWRQTPMYDTETQFRFYWMHEKFLEVPEVSKISKQNQYRFEPLPNFKCIPENITNVLSCNMSLPMDGILFYHKESHYTFGFTPLVLWLRPYMIPEALGIMVPQKFIDRAPPDYKGFAKFKEMCLKNMDNRDESDRKRQEQRHEKRQGKLIEKLKAAGKDYSHLMHNFVPSGNLHSTGEEESTMET